MFKLIFTLNIFLDKSKKYYMTKYSRQFDPHELSISTCMHEFLIWPSWENEYLPQNLIYHFNNVCLFLFFFWQIMASIMICSSNKRIGLENPPKNTNIWSAAITLVLSKRQNHEYHELQSSSLIVLLCCKKERK